jgi:putative transposase
MRRSFKYRLYPNRSQSEVLDAMLESHRRLYNLALRERRDVYEAEERSVSYGEQSARFKETRRALASFAALNFSSAQATLRRLDKAFKAFFRRVKSGDAPGYPRFKPEDRFRTVEFPSYGNGCRLKRNGRLYLQNTGHIKVKLHRPIKGTIKTVSVKRACGKWYVIISCDLGGAPEAAGDGPAVGIDLGLKSFLVTSDGESVEPPRYYRESEKKLRVAQRSVSRKKKGSRRRRKARKRVARLHEKTANQRRDFHHKHARKLANTHGLIVHEALNIEGIARSHLAKPHTMQGGHPFSTSSRTKRKRLVRGSWRSTPGTPRKRVARVGRCQRQKGRSRIGCMCALVDTLPIGTSTLHAIYSRSGGAIRT